MQRVPSTTVEKALPEREDHVGPSGFPGAFAPIRIPDEDHHNVPRSRGGSGKRVNLSPVDPDRHDWYHDMTGNALPSEMLRLFATDAVGYGRYRTIAPYQLRAVFDMAHVENWSELYKEKAVVPSGTVESFEHHPHKFYLHATRHQVEELFHLDCAMAGLETGEGFGWQKTRLIKQACRFFDTQDDPMGSMTEMLSERRGERYTWVDSMHHDVRDSLQSTLGSSELVQLTRGVSMELKGIIAKQRNRVADVYHEWMKAYQDRYGHREKKREPVHAFRATRSRH